MKLPVTKRNRKFLNITFAIEFIILTLAIIATAKANENVNQFCAYVVGIPYASDNFTDEEWKRFEYCRNTLTPTNQ